MVKACGPKHSVASIKEALFLFLLDILNGKLQQEFFFQSGQEGTNTGKEIHHKNLSPNPKQKTPPPPLNNSTDALAPAPASLVLDMRNMDEMFKIIEREIDLEDDKECEALLGKATEAPDAKGNAIYDSERRPMLISIGRAPTHLHPTIRWDMKRDWLVKHTCLGESRSGGEPGGIHAHNIMTCGPTCSRFCKHHTASQSTFTAQAMLALAAKKRNSYSPRFRKASASIVEIWSNLTTTGMGSSSGGSGSVSLGAIVIPIGWEECQPNSDWN
ncbi:hypothetical protein EI94DRAFT_1699719 [Lactarius quietus]|nr:hypothetical protein EI94DRAFT_1699719 [Lactarius quietus]